MKAIGRVSFNWRNAFRLLGVRLNEPSWWNKTRYVLLTGFDMITSDGMADSECFHNIDVVIGLAIFNMEDFESPL